MAAGDVKDVDLVVIKKLTAGAAVTKGDLVHYESDQKWDPVNVNTDAGPFAVAIEAASGDTVEFKAVLFGPVEVTFAGATAAKVGTPLKGCTTATDGPAGSVQVSATFGSGINMGIAYENMDTSGNTYTAFVGLQTE